MDINLQVYGLSISKINRLLKNVLEGDVLLVDDVEIKWDKATTDKQLLIFISRKGREWVTDTNEAREILYTFSHSEQTLKENLQKS